MIDSSFANGCSSPVGTNPSSRVKRYRSVGPIRDREFETIRPRSTRPGNDRLHELTSNPLSASVRRDPHAPQPGHTGTIPIEIPTRHPQPLVAVGGHEHRHRLIPRVAKRHRLPLAERPTPLSLKRRRERERSVSERTEPKLPQTSTLALHGPTNLHHSMLTGEAGEACPPGEPRLAPPECRRVRGSRRDCSRVRGCQPSVTDTRGLRRCLGHQELRGAVGPSR